MWNIFKSFGCQPTPISNPSRLRRRERNVLSRAAFNIRNTTEETVSVNEINSVPVEEAEHVKNREK